jgi:hypothetical protein
VLCFDWSLRKERKGDAQRDASSQSIRTKFRVPDLISQSWELFFTKKSIIIDDFLGVLVVSQLRNLKKRGNKKEVINLTNG